MAMLKAGKIEYSNTLMWGNTLINWNDKARE